MKIIVRSNSDSENSWKIQFNVSGFFVLFLMQTCQISQYPTELFLKHAIIAQWCKCLADLQSVWDQSPSVGYIHYFSLKHSRYNFLFFFNLSCVSLIFKNYFVYLFLKLRLAPLFLQHKVLNFRIFILLIKKKKSFILQQIM